MYQVRLTAEASSDFESLPRVVRGRVLIIFDRLRNWPNVSGAKPLRHGFKGSYRIRTGDYRVLFTVDTNVKLVEVFRISHRGDAYD
jgi:mRNA interferase RelE/StbE